MSRSLRKSVLRHMIVISFDGEFDGLCLNEVREEKFVHSVEIVLAGVEPKDRQFLYVCFQFLC